MTDELTALSDPNNARFSAFDVGWALPVRLAAFLDWLDDSRLAQDTQDALDLFMELPAAKQMPGSLKDDLRADGWVL